MTADEPNLGGEPDFDAPVGSLAAALRDEAVWAEPPAGLLDRIVAEVTSETPPAPDATAPVAPATPETMPFEAPVVPLRHRSWPKTLVAVAAATAAIFGAGFLVGIAGEDDPPASADDILVGQLDLVGNELAPAASAVVDVFDRGAGYALILEMSGLDPAPAGGYYEGWLSPDADADIGVSVGTFHMRGGDGVVVLWSGVAIDEFPQLVVRRHADAATDDDPVVMSGTFSPDA